MSKYEKCYSSLSHPDITVYILNSVPGHFPIFRIGEFDEQSLVSSVVGHFPYYKLLTLMFASGVIFLGDIGC